MANIFRRKLSRSIGTGLTSVGAYTVGAATQVTVIGLTVTNTTASLVKADATLYDGANDTYFAKSTEIPAGASLVVIGGDHKVVLETGDQIRVKSDTAGSLDCILSILEIT